MKYEIEAIWSVDIADDADDMMKHTVFDDFVDIIMDATQDHAMFEIASIHPVKEEDDISNSTSA